MTERPIATQLPEHGCDHRSGLTSQLTAASGFFAGLSGFLHQFQLVGHDLDTIWQNSDEKKIQILNLKCYSRVFV